MLGAPRWVTRTLGRRLRRYVNDGGHLAVIGADSLRRGQPIARVLNSQMIIDWPVTEGDGGKTYFYGTSTAENAVLTTTNSGTLSFDAASRAGSLATSTW